MHSSVQSSAMHFLVIIGSPLREIKIKELQFQKYFVLDSIAGETGKMFGIDENRS